MKYTTEIKRDTEQKYKTQNQTSIVYFFICPANIAIDARKAPCTANCGTTNSLP